MIKKGNYTIMSAKNRGPDAAEKMLNTNKIATLDELKTALNTRSTMTVFRHLKPLDYLSSYSHRGKYYTLHRIAEFNDFGLWSCHSVWFSQYGNLIQTTKEFIDQSSAGFTANELESILHVEVKHSLLKLFESNRVHRERVSGRYLYLTLEPTKRKRQLSARKTRTLELDFDLSFEIEQLADELKAAIILFFSLLDEKQRRLFAGLESFKLGHGGDRKISQLFGMDVHTVAKGRRELFSETVQPNRVRKKGGGRKPVEKKPADYRTNPPIAEIRDWRQSNQRT
jgi:hypothetical protein